MRADRAVILSIMPLLLVALWAQERKPKPSEHPDPPASERAQKSALTDAVSKQLPPTKPVPVKRRNYIDDYIFGAMERDKIPHAALASDQEFLRRIYLDLTGRILDSGAVRKFLADESPDKRDKLIDSLVEPERYAFQEEDPFVDRWTYWFSDLFGNNGGELGTQGRNLFYDYIRASLRLNVPYNEMVEEMLTASALTNWYSGPSNFLIRFHVDDASGNQIHHEDTCDEIAIGTGRVLLGVNLECISCHDGANHLEKINLWLSQKKREEVWRQGAFFSNLTIYRPPPRRQEFTLVENGRGYDNEAMQIPARTGYDSTSDSVVRMKRQKADVYPAFILSGEQPVKGEPMRRAFARILTAHPQFARATVNWIWAEIMGIGIVDPPYNFDFARQDPKSPPPAPWTIQPTHPELLDKLAKDFQDHKFDLRYIIKLIVKSNAYQLSTKFEGQWKPEYANYFARRFVRRLSAEELVDGIAQATGVFPEIPISGSNVKVKYIMQTRSPEDLSGKTLSEMQRFLGSFGQNNRSRAVKSLEGNIVQASLLLNSKIVRDRVKAGPGSRLHKLLNQEPPLSNDDLVEELFLSALSRYPMPEEKKVAVDQVRQYRTQGAEDVMWALVNKLDFIFNY
jgi:hypothetical protein